MEEQLSLEFLRVVENGARCLASKRRVRGVMKRSQSRTAAPSLGVMRKTRTARSSDGWVRLRASRGLTS